MHDSAVPLIAESNHTKVYYETSCWSCGTEVSVKITDRAPRAYCSGCAWAKLAALPTDSKES